MAKKYTIPGVSPDQILEAVKAQTFGTANPGFCRDCGCEADSCEPDMRRGKCEACGRLEVFGAEELMVMGYAG